MHFLHQRGLINSDPCALHRHSNVAKSLVYALSWVPGCSLSVLVKTCAASALEGRCNDWRRSRWYVRPRWRRCWGCTRSRATWRRCTSSRSASRAGTASCPTTSAIPSPSKGSVLPDAIQLVTHRPSIGVKEGKGSVSLDAHANRGPASDLGKLFSCLQSKVENRHRNSKAPARQDCQYCAGLLMGSVAY